MSLFTIIASIFGLAIVLPLAASLLMNTILKNTDDEGIYDEEDS